MIKVKICGITKKEEIQYVNELQPDYVGFVFSKSKRKIDPYDAKNLIQKLDQNIQTVGVFVNESIDYVKFISKLCKLNILQFHGEETYEYCKSFDQKVFKAFRIKDKKSFEDTKKYHVDGYLLDAYDPKGYGGTGKVLDWSIVDTTIHPLILAGGLREDNIEKAIKMTHPDVIDVSSGVEENGMKSYEKMKAFIEKVRSIR